MTDLEGSITGKYEKDNNNNIASQCHQQNRKHQLHQQVIQRYQWQSEFDNEQEIEFFYK